MHADRPTAGEIGSAQAASDSISGLVGHLEWLQTALQGVASEAETFAARSDAVPVRDDERRQLQRLAHTVDTLTHEVNELAACLYTHLVAPTVLPTDVHVASRASAAAKRPAAAAAPAAAPGCDAA